MSRLFDRLVKLEGERGASKPRVRTSFLACVMDGSMNDPIGDAAISTNIRRVTVVAKRRDLGSVEPQIGDTLTFDRRTFAVSKVEPFYHSEIIIEARQC